MDVQPIVEPVKNGWHARSREMNLAVFDSTEEEARTLFREAIVQDEEMRSRPDSNDADVRQTELG